MRRVHQGLAVWAGAVRVRFDVEQGGCSARPMAKRLNAVIGLGKSLLEEARSFRQSFALDLGDGGYRVGAFEGFVGPYARAGLHIAHGVSSLRGIDELPRVDSNAYTRADGIPLPSVMCKLLRHTHRISLSHAFISALCEKSVTSSLQKKC